MSSEYVLTCCSTVDLSKEHLQRIGVPYVCFHFNLDHTEYSDDLGESMSFSDFYKALREGAETSTSQVSIGEYLNFFEPYLQEGKDILHICFSSGLSGAFNSASNAVLIARERYPERKILLLDSLCASSGSGLLIDRLAELKKDGYDIDRLYDYAHKSRLFIHHLFFSSDLSFYVKGGRISRTAALFGGVLNICPLMDMNEEGKLTPREKIRGRRNVMKRIVKRMEELAAGHQDYSGKCYISHSDCLEDAEAVAAMIESRFPNLDGPVLINSVGTVIGSHTGPGTVAVFFFGEKSR